MEERPHKPRRRRCHHCNNQSCSRVGVRQIVEDCLDYDPLDPALRPRRYNEDARRIRTRRTLILSVKNTQFVEDVVLNIDPKMMVGRMTRGIDYCVTVVREALNGAIPDIPPKEEDGGRGELERVSHTVSPINDAFLIRINEHYKDGNNPVAFSRAVDYCIGMLRKAAEGQRGQNAYTEYPVEDGDEYEEGYDG